MIENPETVGLTEEETKRIMNLHRTTALEKVKPQQGSTAQEIMTRIYHTKLHAKVSSSHSDLMQEHITSVSEIVRTAMAVIAPETGFKGSEFKADDSTTKVIEKLDVAADDLGDSSLASVLSVIKRVVLVVGSASPSSS